MPDIGMGGSPNRATQKDIAREAGVTQATVSLALAGQACVSPETRLRIETIARNLGYQPDPYLSGLSAYRKRVRPAHYHGNLAWLSNYPLGRSWRESVVFRGYFDGAAARAQQLGYQIEEHCLCTEAMTSQRLARILRARNISGLLLAPQPEAGQRIDFHFEQFSAVTFGYTLGFPQLHVVAMQQFRSMETAFRKLIALGYTRPGLALPLESDKRSDRNWSASFWSEQRTLPTRNRLPLLLHQKLNKEMFLRWVERYHPDVVLTIGPKLHNWLLEAGIKVPEEVGIALLTVPDRSSIYSGIWENPQIIGAKAVEFLIDLIHRGDCGVPEVPLCHLVAGTWRDGRTVMDRKK